MSQLLNLACHDLGQHITMQAVFGETVKPAEHAIRQIRDILVRILPVGSPRVGFDRDIRWKIDAFGIRVMVSARERLTFGLPCPEHRGRASRVVKTSCGLAAKQRIRAQFASPTQDQAIIRSFNRICEGSCRPHVSSW
jgi:hypothetical protein